jgi:hypothetical protein
MLTTNKYNVQHFKWVIWCIFSTATFVFQSISLNSAQEANWTCQRITHLPTILISGYVTNWNFPKIILQSTSFKPTHETNWICPAFKYMLHHINPPNTIFNITWLAVNKQCSLNKTLLLPKENKIKRWLSLIQELNFKTHANGKWLTARCSLISNIFSIKNEFIKSSLKQTIKN